MKKINYSVKKMFPHHIESCVKLNNQSWRDTYADFLPTSVFDERESKTEKRITRWIESLNNNHYGYIAEIDGKIAGFISYHETYLEKYKGYGEFSIYISKEYKGNGIGSALLKQCVQDLICKGFNSVVIGCFKNNVEAVNFYLKMGGTIMEENTIELGGLEYKEVIIVYKNIREIAH